MKTYKIDPLGKKRPLMLVRGTRLPEVFPDSIAEHLVNSLAENSRGLVVGITGQATPTEIVGDLVFSNAGSDDKSSVVMIREAWGPKQGVTWEDGRGQVYKLECNAVPKGALFGGTNPYYTGPYKDLKQFVRDVVPYTGQPLTTSNCRQWFSYTTEDGVALTFRGCIQAQKQGGEYAGLKIDKIELRQSTTGAASESIPEDLCITLDCDTPVVLGMPNGMKGSVPLPYLPGIGWLQIVATDQFKSHLKYFNESDGNGDAAERLFDVTNYDGFTYNIILSGIFTDPHQFRKPNNDASCRIKVKEKSPLCNSTIGNADGYAVEYFGFSMVNPIKEGIYADVSPDLDGATKTVDIPAYGNKCMVIRVPNVSSADEVLHVNIPAPSTNKMFSGVTFVTMNGRKVTAYELAVGDNELILPEESDMFAFFHITNMSAGTISVQFSRGTKKITTLEEKIKHDVNALGKSWQLADNFEVVQLTGENQKVTGNVIDESGKAKKVFVVPAGEGGFKTNLGCLCRELYKNADGSYKTTVDPILPFDVNARSIGKQFDKRTNDVFLLPFGDSGTFNLTTLTAEDVQRKRQLIQTARAPHDSADQLLTDVLAAFEISNAAASFTNKIEGFDLSNTGDYIYVTGDEVKDRILNGHAWIEIVNTGTGTYSHCWISDLIGNGTSTIGELVSRSWGFNLDNKSIFIAKHGKGSCTLDLPVRTPGFYSADGQLIKAMTKEEVEQNYGYNNCPANANEAVKSATNFVWPEGVTTIGTQAFRGCRGLTSVTIPEGVTTIGTQAFADCTDLTSVTIPEGVTTIGPNAFADCTDLTSVTIPEGVTKIEDQAFSGCTALTSVTIPEGVTSVGNFAFSGCTSLTSVTIPEGVTTIGPNAFSGCTSLTSVAIPEGVTKIESGAFNFCIGLTSVEIPNTVTSIGTSAFSECKSLNTLTVPNTVTSIGDWAFKNVPKVIYGGSATGSPWGAQEVVAS